MRSEKLEFAGGAGAKLAARLDSPDGPPKAYALFAHCFTCSKDIFAASRIAQSLAEHGIAVLRFDFTGLGSSEGEFAHTNFSSNIGDLLAAVDHLRQTREAPQILIGHSLGGAAVLAAAGRVPEAKAVATIGAPFDPGHVAHLFRDDLEKIEADGEAEVLLVGRPFRIQKQFVDDIRAQSQEERIGGLKKALLVFHSPIDQTVGIDNAGLVFGAAKHPKSFVSLDSADHLLSRRADAEYVAAVLAAWSARYVDAGEAPAVAVEPVAGAVVVRETGWGKFQQAVAIGPHRLVADEPESYGGKDTGPSPYDLLLAGLGACTAMTVRLYADRKKWPLEKTEVVLRHEKMHAEDCADCETREGRIDHITRELRFHGDLDAEQRAKLLEISEKCPVHRTLHSEIKIDTAEG
ncbi:MAG: alpha/beta fold hydrolase [Inquilinus sp.]|nr:alpha/beta fold hydrolase [Inquilinus sp.]